MKRIMFLLALVSLSGIALLGLAPGKAADSPKTTAPPAAWSIDASYIEACSCHLFCPCYFNASPEHPSCEFNIAARVEDGKAGDVSLKGAKFWLTGDLGEDFGVKKKSPWLVVTFDPSVSKAQRDAIAKMLPQIYQPFDKIDLDESAVSWSIGPTEARAKLANNKGEMVLDQWKGNDGGKSMLQNVKYFNAKTNTGFVMYKSKVHRWNGFGHKFDYTGRNAFTIRIQASGTL